ncbi:MAG: ChaB family protein [Methanomassiliicoccales archaeon]
MPYDDISELPKGVRKALPEEAQEIFKGAFNSAWEEYSDPERRKDGASREEVAMRVAWSAVKRKYKKDRDGNWVRK